jgi:twinkle protein
MKKTNNKSRFIGHGPCNACGSSDAVGIYEEGPATCFACGEIHTNLDEETKPNMSNDFVKEKPFGSKLSLEDISNYAVRGFRERNLPKTITEFYGVKAGVNSAGEVIEHYYPYGVTKTTGYKIRKLPKDFRATGTIEGLFGQQLFNGGRRLVITEGELDALSVAYAQHTHYNKFYPVVSLPSSTGMKQLLEQRDWVRGFDEVVLMLDNDEAGQKALKEACKIVGVDKVKIAKLKTKDASDELMKHGHHAIMEAIWNAQPWSPSGILQGDELWDKFLEREATESIPFPPCLTGVNEKTLGMRFGEVDLFTSGTGSGKSTVIKEIILWLKETTEDSIGIISLEESPGDTVEKLIEMQMKKKLSENPELKVEEKREAFDYIFGDKRIKLLDHMGSVADDSLMNKIETLCLMGCKYLILDHLTIAVSEVESGDANAAVDKVMSDILKTAKKHNVWFGVISHLRKTGLQSKSFEEGKLPSMDDIKGSGSIKQISFQIIAFARNMVASNEAERNTIKMRVLKSRFTGRTGDAGGSFYNQDTGRLEYVNHAFDAEPEL